MGQEIDDLVDEWTPEPLVSKSTPFEEAELEKRPVIVGFVQPRSCKHVLGVLTLREQPERPSCQTREWPHRDEPRFLQFLQLCLE